MALHVPAILLAAGSSTRMGRLKQLLPLNNKPLIKHCLDSIIAARIDEIVVVLGADAADVETAIEDYPVRRVLNPDRASDMTESIRIGLRETHESSSGCLVCLSDHPLVALETIRTLLDKHQEDSRKIIIPVYHNRKGHPTLFPMSLLRLVFDGYSMRDVIREYAAEVEAVPVDDKGVVIDIDTVEDYEEVMRMG